MIIKFERSMVLMRRKQDIQKQKQTMKELRGPKDGLINMVQERARLLALIPSCAFRLVKDKDIRADIFRQVPKEEREFILAQFTKDEEAACIMLSYVTNQKVQIIVERLVRKKQPRIQKMNGLRQTHDGMIQEIP